MISIGLHPIWFSYFLVFILSRIDKYRALPYLVFLFSFLIVSRVDKYQGFARFGFPIFLFSLCVGLISIGLRPIWFSYFIVFIVSRVDKYRASLDLVFLFSCFHCESGR